MQYLNPLKSIDAVCPTGHEDCLTCDRPEGIRT